MGFIESLQRVYVVRKIFLPEKNPSVVSNVFTEQTALLASIKEKAHTIAENVRKYGEQKFGPMWAQGYAMLSDGRIVFLQQSHEQSHGQFHGGVQVGRALEINISPALNNPYRIHIRYDFGRYDSEHDEINTYEMRQENGEPIIMYGVYNNRPDYNTRFPPSLTLRDIVRPVDEILKSVEIASNKIMWKKPEPTPVIL